ncbi:hypothetical protein IMY05_016G0011800 [Salix suchowensis]|nr:hypothetical protein IMY05_016G0011800 [Salix suchowensis]
MAFGDGLSRFSSMSIALIILTSFLLMPSPVHSSRSCNCFQWFAMLIMFLQCHETTVLAAGNRDRASAQEIHPSYMIKRVGKGASSLVADEESERQVPTGPDPLHHNSKPTTRP